MLKEDFNEQLMYNEIASPYLRDSDDFNTFFFRHGARKWKTKGREPNPLADEYFDVPDLMDADYVRRARAEEDDGAAEQMQQNLAQSSMSGMLRSFAMLAAGAVVVTFAYTAAVERRKSAFPSDVSFVTDAENPAEQGELDAAEKQYDYSRIKWIWSEDGMTVTAYIPSIDRSVETITVTPDITVETTDATCTEDGVRITTAVIHSLDGTTYMDVKTMTLPATGHSFEELISDGSSITYHCPDCGSEIKVEITVEEETVAP